MEILQAGWPEPIVRVQSLAESGIKAVPDRYVRPPSQMPSAELSEDFNIPIIDLSEEALYSPATLAALAEACKEWGFFQVVNHGMKPELMAKFREAWRSFFHQPLEEKQKYANSPKDYIGYGSRLGVEKGAILDWGDYFYLPIFPESKRNLDKWPDQPPSLRETIDEYSQEVVELCRTLMKLVSISLGLEAYKLDKIFGGDEAETSMRINFYPKCPQPELTLGLSRHSDPGGLTVLLPDDRVTGLQVRKGNAWVTVNSSPDAFVVNIGDQIQIITNATYKSVEHRVVANSINERVSIALFYNPKGDLPIAPDPKLVTLNQPPLYKCITFNEYRLHIRAKGTSGKSQVESLSTK